MKIKFHKKSSIFYAKYEFEKKYPKKYAVVILKSKKTEFIFSDHFAIIFAKLIE